MSKSLDGVLVKIGERQKEQYSLGERVPWNKGRKWKKGVDNRE